MKEKETVQISWDITGESPSECGGPFDITSWLMYLFLPRIIEKGFISGS